MNSRANSPAGIISVILFALAAGVFYWATVSGMTALYAVAVLLVLLGLLTPLSMQMANQWEKAVVLRLGRLKAIKGPGIFLIMPFVDSVAVWIDQRIQTTEFNAEQALTRDTVPTNIDAILFWQVHDPERAALEITDYRQAIGRVAQTSLREMIGSSPLTTLLSDRKNADKLLKEEIGRKTADWGVSVISVEIRDVAIPAALQDAMSRQAQAEREKEARVILGAAEQEVAQKFLDAANIYAQNPAALQLRAMNIIYETTKERGATILIPTMMVDSMNAGGMMGLANLANKEGNAPRGPWQKPEEEK
jgi:regulator of protease activity HflC (stomatin/prohibitin superfamily)